jgi:hypothetical protein
MSIATMRSSSSLAALVCFRRNRGQASLIDIRALRRKGVTPQPF